MKSLLFVGPYPPPYGGIASHLHDLLPSLVEKGYEVATLTESRENKHVSNDGVDNFYVNLKRYAKKNLLTVLISLFKMRRKKYDLDFKAYVKNVIFSCCVEEFIVKRGVNDVFVYDNRPCFIIPFLRETFKQKLHLVSFIFGDFYLKPKRYLAIPQFVDQVFASSSLVMASSRYCGNSIRTVMNLDYDVSVVYIGVDCKLYNPELDRMRIRNQLGILESAFVFLFLGRMDKSMGLDFVMKKAQALLALGENVHLVLAGAKGALTDEAEALADSEERIHCVVNVPFDDKPYYYSACDVFLAPTIDKHACMGVSIKEAMAVGRPIVASSSGGIPEAVVNGETGYTIPFDSDRQVDAEAFMVRCKELYANSVLREDFSKAGRQRAVDTFSNEQSVMRYEDFLEKLNKESE